MKCSKCKIFSIHLPNFDSYICEKGHVFCRRCSPKPYSHCSVCNGKIVQKAELLIEGVPKTIFHQTQNDDCKQISGVGGNARMSMVSDSEEDWPRTFDYRYSEEFPSNNESPKHNAREMVGGGTSPRRFNNGMPRKIPSNHSDRANFNDNLRPRQSVCHFKTLSKESIRIEDTAVNNEDPKNLYKKTIASDLAPDFDPMKDYCERIAQVNTIHEYYKRPYLATTSSSKTDINIGGESMSDSSTLIEHLNEFRHAADNECKAGMADATSTSAFVTKSKTRVPINTPPVSQSSSFQDTSYLAKKPEVEILYSEPYKTEKQKIDVGTMMDFCLTASTNIALTDVPAKEQEEHITHNPHMAIHDEKKGTKNQLNTRSPSLRTLLREQLKNQVYSQFDRAPEKAKNVFMIKGLVPGSEMLPIQSIAVTAASTGNKLSDTINCEVDKALKNLAAFPMLQCFGSQRRDELVKQSKNLLRQQILDEVYSHFEKSSSAKHSAPSHLEEIHKVNSNGQTERKRQVYSASEESANTLKDSAIEVANNQSACDKTEKKAGLLASLPDKKKRTVGISTESYPKLNPDLNFLLSNKDSMQKYHSLCCAERQNKEYTQEMSNSHEDDPNIRPSPSKLEKTESDVVEEISEQFEKNINLVSNQSCATGTQNVKDLTEHETVLKADSPSLNTQVKSGYYSNKDSEGLKYLTNQEKDMINENSSLKLSESQYLVNKCMREEQIHQNVYFFQYPKRYMYSPKGLAASIGDKYVSPGMKAMTKTLVEDFREEPLNTSDGDMLDVNKFIQYIMNKFPTITLKQLKQIILNLPTNETDADETNEIATRLPPSATFRPEYDEYDEQTDISDGQTIDQTMTIVESTNFTDELTLSSTVTAWRAHFSPPINQYDEPAPQCKPINRFDAEVSLADNVFRGVKAAAELNLSRYPLICPVTACSKSIFVSEFSKHLKVDHVKIPVETLTPGRCKNLFVDPKSDEFGVNKCHALYLVRNKIRDLGSKEFKDYLPLLVMVTKVSLLQLISPLHPVSEEVDSSLPNYLMIWLTGLSAQDLPIYYSLTAWHRYSATPKCHIAHSGQIYSIRKNHDDRSVYHSGSAMLLSQNQVKLLTNNGQDMIELQVIVH